MTLKTRQFVKTASALAALLVATRSFAERASFSSPSGNIICYLEHDDGTNPNESPLVCLILEADWVGPPYESEDCGLDQTRQVMMFPTGRGEVFLGCHGDVFWPHPTPKVSYGSTWSVTGFDCSVEQTGVTCENTEKNGFRLRRASVELY